MSEKEKGHSCTNCGKCKTPLSDEFMEMLTHVTLSDMSDILFKMRDAMRLEDAGLMHIRDGLFKTFEEMNKVGKGILAVEVIYSLFFTFIEMMESSKAVEIKSMSINHNEEKPLNYN